MFLFTTVFLSLLINANPTGSPICAAEKARIHASLQPASVNLGYGLETTAGPNNTFYIKITGSRPDYQGILLYTTSPTRPSIHLGGFSLPSTKFRHMDRNLCKSQGIFQQSYATLTHANPARTPIGTVFRWYPIDRSEVGLGMTVHAVVASQDVGQSGKARWQLISTVLKDASPLEASTTTIATDADATVVDSTSSVTPEIATTTVATATATTSPNNGEIAYPGLITLFALIGLF